MSLPTDVLDAPPLDSKSSVGTASSTLDTSDVRSSVGTTVKFAPLPQIDPTRKRCLAPLGVCGRSRRKQLIHQEAGPLTWSRDPGLPEDILEDPLITLAKFVKKTSRTLWRRVRGSSKAAMPVECSGEPVIDIRSPVEVVDEDKRQRRATWSPSDGRRTLDPDEPRRRKSDLSPLS